MRIIFAVRLFHENIYGQKKRARNYYPFWSKPQSTARSASNGVTDKVFVIKPQKRVGSPLAVDGIKLNLAAKEILESIEEGRRVF